MSQQVDLEDWELQDRYVEDQENAWEATQASTLAYEEWVRDTSYAVSVFKERNYDSYEDKFVND